jgi:hypothetical protein
MDKSRAKISPQIINDRNVENLQSVYTGIFEKIVSKYALIMELQIDNCAIFST